MDLPPDTPGQWVSMFENLPSHMRWLLPNVWERRATNRAGRMPDLFLGYPNLSDIMFDLLNMRKIQSRKKGRESTRVTQGNLGALNLSTPGLFPI